MADLDELKQGAAWMWARGDYARIAEWLETAARELADACAISGGQEVLDVAAGNGNLAVVAAREGAAVAASDLDWKSVGEGKSVDLGGRCIIKKNIDKI